MTTEKKALLKKIIMEKVREEMHKEALQKAEAKEKRIGEIVRELPAMKGLSKGMAQTILSMTEKTALCIVRIVMHFDVMFGQICPVSTSIIHVQGKTTLSNLYN